MIPVEQFVTTLTSAGVDFFCGVPDSLLKNFCAYIASGADGIMIHVERILECGRCQEASAEYCMPIKEILTFI